MYYIIPNMAKIVIRKYCQLYITLQDLGSDTDNLEPVESGRLEILDVEDTCSLRDFVEKTHQLVPYNPRRLFFEFVGANENISDDKEIILIEKVSSTLIKCIILR